ncbi:T9SS type A sorting domain-containing protein [Hymenobacter gummosus]|uniref:T9SS type A sorting domain-containing protein n=1 Tax=Hymenobacter gummosus TaxID=1776032 RepID=A0A431TZ74_9BACT|nr:T9SS type A sorting domain-containing protein [Hymenobacter gummosus]RTQ47174.1 T9SS type A sorting domain-containing protein [Hymenobacter gummosus]
MKHLYACLCGLLLASAAPAQTIYRPLLRAGVLYQLSEVGTPGDTTHTVRLSYAGPVTSPDSLGRFSGRVVGIPTRWASACRAEQVARPDGLFGATVVIGYRRHEYELRAANGRTLLLKTQAPLNQVWTATAAGLTARTTARGVGTVLGVPDSITTITFSDGQTLLLSKQFGFVEGPALGSYLNGQRPRRLALTALQVAGRWVGQPAVGHYAIHDYQPGDVFLRYAQQRTTSGGDICSESWTRDSVLTRRLSAQGDTVRYTIWRRVLTRNYGRPGSPAGFCQNTPGTVLTAGSTHSLTVAATDESLLSQLTDAVGGPAGQIWRPLTRAGWRTAEYRGRKVQDVIMRQVCLPATGDSLQLGSIIDNESGRRYAAGLGLVLSYTGGVYYEQLNTLLGYRKVNLPTSSGTETWGSMRTFANILKAADYRPAASTAAFPNPFARELMVRFEAQRAQPVEVRLFNGLGQLVHRQTAPVAAGAQQLTLAVPALAAGLYTLQLTVDGRSQVLKVMAAQ